MSADAVRAASDNRMLYPNTKFAYLAGDHVRMDDLTATDVYEARALRALCADPSAAAIIGGIGAGKSSMIADICAQLPDTHVALRVPVVGIDDPTSTSETAALALSCALDAIKLEAHQLHALQVARSDQTTNSPGPSPRSGKISGRIGGGVFPAEVSVETETLRQQLDTRQLAGDRLFGLDRLVTILVSRGLQPIFVFEDTEAAIGGRASLERVDAFFRGPVAAFMNEVEASFLIAIQDHIATQEPFQRVAPGLLRIELPQFTGEAATSAVSQIVAHRLSRSDPALDIGDVFSPDALAALGAAYSRAGSVRHVLAATQSAADHASQDGAETILRAHIDLALAEWDTQPAPPSA